MKLNFLLTAMAAFGLLCVPAGAVRQQPPPDSIWVNGVVYTVDGKFSKAGALAVRDGRIVAVGTTTAIRRLAGKDTQVHDLKGACVTPGLIDCHGHMSGLGSYATGRLDLHDTRSFQEVVARVQAAVLKAKPGDWILGGRWDQSLWGDREFPTHGRLSAVSPDNPVWLERVDGHAALANAKAMALAGISGSTANPPGGEVLRTPAGEPTGLFVDNAQGLIERRIPGGRVTTADLILQAQSRCVAVGLTGVHDAGIGTDDIAAYRQLAADGRLKMRIYGMVGGSVGADYFRRNKPQVGERFTLRSTKLMADGAMGSRGAWLLEPYSDRPTDEQGKPYTGLPVMRPEFIREVSLAAAQNGWQVCTHAIGDRAIREVLGAYETAFQSVPIDGRADFRFRIEHAQNPHPADIARFAKLNVIPSMQQSHATSDMRWTEQRLGRERAKTAYAWRQFQKAGCRIAGGSDFPVEDPNPLWGIYAAVTRQDHQGLPAGGWMPGERQTREEALRSFTIDAAYAAFEEKVKGSLEPGKYADFVVWSTDIVTCPPKDLVTARPRQVVIGGR